MYPSTVHKDLGRITWNLINGAIWLFPLTYRKFLKINSCKGRSQKMSPSCRPNCFMKKIIGNAFFLYAVGSLDMGFILSFLCFTSLKFTLYSSWSTCHVVTYLVTWKNAKERGIGIILVREELGICPTTISCCFPNKSPPAWCSLEREG